MTELTHKQRERLRRFLHPHHARRLRAFLEQRTTAGESEYRDFRFEFLKALPDDEKSDWPASRLNNALSRVGLLGFRGLTVRRGLILKSTVAQQS